jgi:hypothetical protein
MRFVRSCLFVPHFFPLPFFLHYTASHRIRAISCKVNKIFLSWVTSWRTQVNIPRRFVDTLLRPRGAHSLPHPNPSFQHHRIISQQHERGRAKQRFFSRKWRDETVWMKIDYTVVWGPSFHWGETRKKREGEKQTALPRFQELTKKEKTSAPVTSVNGQYSGH